MPPPVIGFRIVCFSHPDVFSQKGRAKRFLVQTGDNASQCGHITRKMTKPRASALFSESPFFDNGKSTDAE